MRRSIIFFWFFLLFFPVLPSLSDEGIGRFVAVTGVVLVAHGDAKSLQVKAEDPIFLGDVIETKKGAVTLQFRDGTELVVREDSKILITQFLFDPGARRRETAITILFGKIKAVIAKTFDKKKSKTEFKTPTAVAGVRGTTLALDVTAKQTKVYCLKGLLEVFNPELPSKIISLPAGKFSEVIKGEIPGLPMAIPAAIRQALENQFGFPTSLEEGVRRLKNKIPLPGFPF